MLPSPNYDTTGKFFVAYLVIVNFIVLSLSVNFHIFMCHSKEMYQRTLFYDLVGIVIGVSACQISTLFLGMPWNSEIFTPYLATFLVMDFCCIYMIKNPHFRTPAGRKIRSAFFACLTLLSLVPLFHAHILQGMIPRVMHSYLLLGFISFTRTSGRRPENPKPYPS